MGFLSETQKQFYKENGFILLDNVFSETEIDQCSVAYDELFELKKSQDSNMEATWKGSWNENSQNKSVLSIHNLQCHSSIFTKVLMNDNLLDAVSDIIESPNILLHHTKAHIKPPEKGARIGSLNDLNLQDYHYFPYKNDSLIAVFVHLDDSDPENGGLAIFPKSHLMGPQENKSDVPTNFYVDQEKFALSKAHPVIAKKGQVLIFSYLLVHGSFPNVSTRNRRMLLIQLMSAEDTPLNQTHMSPCHGMVLRGKNVRRNADLSKRHETDEKLIVEKKIPNQ
ncbi:Phytanoyl-CoA dioxygenase, peroxisomal [Orchesella cincta]|uniref:phytanoyl-CoA dioxygenase n=1 Tax=Orchesella cincta TaxID=48709 RepID=A0A1D2N3L1_ORCCI|nr:Phytanoyl-CoA dioxygenase, peroxisomal [Orchesella cincta]